MMSKMFINNINNIKGKVRGNMLVNMRNALFFASISAQNIAPIDTNKLRTNVRREIKKTWHNVLLGTFTFEQEYAEVQHEHTEYRHPKGGQSKYVEKTLRRKADKIMRILAKGVVS